MQLMTPDQKKAAMDKKDDEKKRENRQLNQRRNDMYERQLLKQMGVEI